ncbi:MAG: Tat (twin-arginine translocation) pathway signal sequence domain protein [Rhodocyclales bacterium]|nr:Tat (twin-arginine translocation) pathway signal sequence domain protein [Rhodocyclales bacterium]
MKRRDFLSLLGASGLLAVSPTVAIAAAPSSDAANAERFRRLLILVELKGGNDGLNTVVPYADPAYYALRPQLAIAPDALFKLNDHVGLNKVMAPLMPLWENGHLAVVQGLGYPQPNLSHFRSIEIWDTASRSNQYLDAGWISRTLASNPVPSVFTADALVVGSSDLGPLAGGARAVTLGANGDFEREARLATLTNRAGGGALAHVLKVEADVSHAAQSLGNARQTNIALKTEFPNHDFGRTCRTACETLARYNGVAVMRLTIGSFDTHQNQSGRHSALLTQLSEGMASLKSALVELGNWDDSMIMTYSEFGRRPRENQSGGTDHGTVAPHFVMGGRVRGGLYGQTPTLAHLDETDNLPWQIDFRQMYATVLDRLWQLPSEDLLGGKFQSLNIV